MEWQTWTPVTHGREGGGPRWMVTGVNWMHIPSLVGSHSLQVARLLSHNPYLGTQAVQEGTVLIINYTFNDQCPPRWNQEHGPLRVLV